MSEAWKATTAPNKATKPRRWNITKKVRDMKVDVMKARRQFYSASVPAKEYAMKMQTEQKPVKPEKKPQPKAAEKE